MFCSTGANNVINCRVHLLSVWLGLPGMTIAALLPEIFRSLANGYLPQFHITTFGQNHLPDSYDIIADSGLEFFRPARVFQQSVPAFIRS